ncbi:RES family NAD+ phosphorylase [Duganella violaceipulchra]|uniref:RES domain-containing protein n=1 Tax=Duganella violaceipulchra TaxID=2849652 RepID=A0AA41L0V9_9BURK|nr:RES family NAD+ phosphorylase [Duganella violaceicalia]MBV6319573.1 RES family NAD+ phosphorylase [Duganella violaceicalia]MCP2006615.1 RES domain-containing protein [Duganella violaceicalia]
MTMSLWRIAVEAPSYKANDLTGAGAKMSGGRWNNIGTPLIYSATNIALATIETILHIRSGGLPFNRFLVRIDVPDVVWNSRLVLDPLPGGWDAIPCGMTSRTTGDAWVASGSSALLLVPSVSVPDEYNVLINPQHPDVASITATTIKRWIYDPRFFS